MILAGNTSPLGTTIEPSEMTLGAGWPTAIARPTFLSTTTTVSPGTTTLVVGSAVTHEATGVYTHTYKMPVVTTLDAGWAATFINKSTGAVTIQSSGNNSIVVLAGGQSATLVCRSISADTTAAAWDIIGKSPVVLTGTYALHNVGTITAGNSAVFSITIAGAVVGDIVDVSMPQPFTYGGVTLNSAVVSAANTVQVFVWALPTGTDAEWDTGQTFTARIIRY